jgi:hypothetical protein
VAGFDLAKLVVGGHGAFGTITEAHLRLRALPEADRTLAWTGSRDAIVRATGRLLRDGAMLAACEVCSPAHSGAGADSAWTLMARAMGTRVGVAEELDAAAECLAACKETVVSGTAWTQWQSAVGDWEVRVRIGADPSRWDEAARFAEEHGATGISATVPRGIVRARFTHASVPALRALRQACSARGWPMTLEQADDATLRAVGIWGALSDGPLRIARALRTALGPEGTQHVPLWAEETTTDAAPRRREA